MATACRATASRSPATLWVAGAHVAGGVTLRGARIGGSLRFEHGATVGTSQRRARRPDQVASPPDGPPQPPRSRPPGEDRASLSIDNAQIGASLRVHGRASLRGPVVGRDVRIGSELDLGPALVRPGPDGRALRLPDLTSQKVLIFSCSAWGSIDLSGLTDARPGGRSRRPADPDASPSPARPPGRNPRPARPARRHDAHVRRPAVRHHRLPRGHT